MQREQHMQREIHDLVQGSEEWAAFRLNHHGASEAAAMLGLSTKVKRSELIRMKATGISKEFTAWVLENILDHGHRVEAAARPIVVRDIVKQKLYPVTCSLGRLSASCDGLDMSDTIAFEHKQWAAALAASVAAGELPEEHMPQCQQVLMVTGAEKLIFVVSDGTEENMVHMWVHPDAAWFQRIAAGWDQFDLDVAAYEHVEVLPAAVAAPMIDLPAPVVRVSGTLSIISNLNDWHVQLTDFIEGINKTPQTDEDFANVDAAIKKLEKAEQNLVAAEEGAFSQALDIDEMRRTVAMLKKMARDNRLMLTKLQEERKKTVRIEIINGAKEKQIAHIDALNLRLGKPYMPQVLADFATAIKGKKTVASLKDAADTELARFKIEANAIADKIQLNMATLRELATNHAFLFADTPAIVLKANDDLTTLVKLRIAEHDAAEAAKAEALRVSIAAQEKAKAEAAAADQLRIQQAEAARVAAAQADADRAAAAAETKRQLDAQAAQFAAARAAEAQAPVPAAAIPASAAPELARTAEFYDEPRTAAPARAAELQGLADQSLDDRRAMAAASRATGVPVTTRPYPMVGGAPDAMLDAVDAVSAELHPTDDEILELGMDFGLPPAEWIARLETFITAVHAGQIDIAA